jgi:arsenite methyltransferase
MPGAEDKWKKWLLEGRFAGSKQKQRRDLKHLSELAETLLGFARLKESEVVLDVGAGDGLIAFAALSQVSQTGRAILADVSRPLLEHARAVATERGLLERCRFIEASADELSLADGSVDLVTTRSVLIYVTNKRKALSEFYRVLRAGGRIALWEPVHRPWERISAGFFEDYATTPVGDLMRRLSDFYRKLLPNSSPMIDFDEWDLVGFAKQAGFETIIANFSINVLPGIPTNWEDFIGFQGNPNIPSIAGAMKKIFSEDERATLEKHIRPLVEKGYGKIHQAGLFLWGWKPGGWSWERAQSD